MGFAYFAYRLKKADIIKEIKSKQSYLCTGLDSEMGKLPRHLDKTGNGLLTFNRAIVEATKDLSVAYKINTAFYEQYGSAGWEWMEETLSYLPSNTFNIADAKRGDIGNTSTMYARAFFETMNFDAITVSPYMGEDSLRPFLEFSDKTIICLALTSNPGHKDFQTKITDHEKALYENVLETVSKWGSADQLMFVVGATRADRVASIRKIVPEHFLLVPGVGAQGGSLSDISHAAGNQEVGLLVNSSRGIIYAGNEEDFSEKAHAAAAKLQLEMAGLIQELLV